MEYKKYFFYKNLKFELAEWSYHLDNKRTES